MTAKQNHMFVLGGAAALMLSTWSGCATTYPPSELIKARDAYAESERSVAAQYNPAGLHEAKVALEHAEKLYKQDDNAHATRDAAYIAMRRAERAKAEGQTAQLSARAADAEKSAAELRTKSAEQARQQLDSARDQLASATEARQAAEARAQEAMTQLRLSRAVEMAEEPRGTVLTIPGAFLFASNESRLQPTASDKLDKIVAALKEQQDRKILVEGHTDSTGTNEFNQQLAQERANAVASYLTSHGIPSDKVTATGIGETRPVATNDTAEGRANNRRVEITVQKLEPQ